MNVDTHAFRDAFMHRNAEGFALEFDDAQSRAAAAAPFVTQKHDNAHLRMIVCETMEAAEKEREALRTKIKVAIRKVSVAEVRTFAAIGYFGIPALVFLRDRNDAVAPL